MRDPTQHLDLLVGQRPARAWQGHGSFLLFDFGEQLPPDPLLVEKARGRGRDPSEIPPRHERCLWLYGCSWTVADGDDVLAHNESSDVQIARVLALMENLHVTSATLDANLNVAVTFGDQLVLRTAEGIDDMDRWILFGPEGTLAATSEGTAEWEDAA